jgi:hypothetical protein
LASAATQAVMSPQFSAGMRQLSAKMFHTSSLRTPWRNSLTGRSRKPSWNTSEFCMSMLPGA